MSNSLPVVILCGGEGTRMREETEFKPKPMVTIGGLPILYHIMKIYSHHGHTRFILALGYKGEVIRQFFLTSEVLHHEPPVSITDETVHCTKEGWTVTFVDTGLRAMTGCRLFRCRKLLQGVSHFMCTYGDGLTDADFKAEVAYAKQQGSACTLLGVHPRSIYGLLKAGLDGKVSAFIEKPILSDHINGGFYVMTPKALDYLSDDESVVLETKPFEKMVADGQMSMYEHNGFWYGMDTYKDYLEINSMWAEKKTPWKKW